jgi:hypothetical protein
MIIKFAHIHEDTEHTLHACTRVCMLAHASACLHTRLHSCTCVSVLAHASAINGFLLVLWCYFQRFLTLNIQTYNGFLLVLRVWCYFQRFLTLNIQTYNGFLLVLLMLPVSEIC